MDRELDTRLNRAVKSLRPDYKIFFVLAEVDNFSPEEIARITGLTIPLWKTRLHHARNMV